MFLSIVTIDVTYTVSTGTKASSAVTEQINFTPGGSELLGTMERVSRRLDRLGDSAFAPYVWLTEMLLYGVLAPLFIAGPLAWEARRRRWSRSAAVGIAGFAGLLIALWLVWKYPDPAGVYYGLVNALLLSCRAMGLSYYAGSLVYFVFLPPLFALGYTGKMLWQTGHDGSPAGEASLSTE